MSTVLVLVAIGLFADHADTKTLSDTYGPEAGVRRVVEELSLHLR